MSIIERHTELFVVQSDILPFLFIEQIVVAECMPRYSESVHDEVSCDAFGVVVRRFDRLRIPRLSTQWFRKNRFYPYQPVLRLRLRPPVFCIPSIQVVCTIRTSQRLIIEQHQPHYRYPHVQLRPRPRRLRPLSASCLPAIHQTLTRIRAMLVTLQTHVFLIIPTISRV